MFILFSIFSGLKVWFVNYTSLHENSRLNDFDSITFVGEVSNNLLNDSFEPTVYKTLEPCWQSWKNYNGKITSVISKWGASK